MTVASGAAPPAAGRELTVIFKGLNRCNAGCTFCAVGKAGGSAVTWEDFEIVARELESLVERRGIERLEFTFHGGEPTMLGADFIDRACDRLSRLPVRLGFSMQSNLLAWNEGLGDIVRRHGIRLGTSIDPIAGDRLDGSGRDAYPTWLRNYERVCQEVRPPGAIFVVTRKALGKARELIEVARSITASTGERFGLQINPVYAQGRAASDADVLVTPEEFGEYLVDLWRVWREAPDEVQLGPIQDFSDHFFPVEGRRPKLDCSFGGCCSGHHLGIDFDLNVAGCGRRLDSKAFLGNLRAASLPDILEGSEEAARIGVRSTILGAGACAGCPYFAICNGGCPDDAAITGNLMARFHWCAGYRMLFEAMDEERRRLLAEGQRLGREILAVVEPLEIAATERSDADRSVWLLPTRDGRALRFEGGLGKALEAVSGEKRIYVHNDRVRSLALWEHVLRKPDVLVVLFEAEGMEAALHVLNAIGATIALDTQTLLQASGGADLVRSAVERFLFDPRWESRLLPFAEILRGAVQGASGRPLNRFSIPPGGFHLKCSPAVAACAEPAAASIVAAIREEESLSAVEWLGRRSPCLECDLVAVCNGQLAAGDRRPCHPVLREIVARLAEVADDLRVRMSSAKG